MRIRMPTVEFATVFAVTFVATALVTLLWNLVGHGASMVDWEASFRLAIILSVVSTLARAWRTRE